MCLPIRTEFIQQQSPRKIVTVIKKIQNRGNYLHCRSLKYLNNPSTESCPDSEPQSKMQDIQLFEVSPDTWDFVAKKFEKTTKLLDYDVQVLQEWAKTQPHLPNILDVNSLRNFLILNKCSVEIAKKKIDNYYTFRSKMKALFGDVNPRHPYHAEFNDSVYLTVHPELTEEKYRVVFFKFQKENVAYKYDPLNSIKTLINLQEIRLREDVMFGEVFVVNCEGFSLDVILKHTPTLIYNSLVLLYEKVYSSRFKGIYIINLPTFGVKVLTLAKSVMKPKLFERIHIVTNTESLKDFIPLKLLPKEYGGEGFSLQEMQDATEAKFKEFQELFDLLDEIKVDENLRPAKLEDDDTWGVHGNFKNIDID